MADALTVTIKPQPDAIVLEVSYGKEQMGDDNGRSELSRELRAKYQSGIAAAGGSKKSCVVELKDVDTGGSALVRSLFDLYEEVRGGGKDLVCVGYPRQYLHSLTALGLYNLPGFRLDRDLERAIASLR